MTTSRTERLWIGGAAFLVAVLALVGWFLLISPQRSETADVQAQIADSDLQNVTLQARIDQLGRQKSRWKSYERALQDAREALPDRSELATFLRSVQSIATSSSATVASLTVSDPTAVTPAAGNPPPAAPPSAPSAGGAGTATSASGIYAIPIRATVTGSTRGLSRFLGRLQAGQPRAVLVRAVTRTDGTGPGGSSLQLSMTAFVAPEPAATSAAATGTPAVPGH